MPESLLAFISHRIFFKHIDGNCSLHPRVFQGIESIGKQYVGVFSTDKNRVVKITRFSSEMVLQTTKHTVIYPSLGFSLEVIALCLVV
jgi:hypothetical protein